jgi:hypothetical protein
MVRGVDRKLRGCSCHYARIGEVPGHGDCVDAGANASNPTVLHGARATAPPLASTRCSSNSTAAAVHHVNLQLAAEDVQP